MTILSHKHEIDHVYDLVFSRLAAKRTDRVVIAITLNELAGIKMAATSGDINP